jgi:transporter family-2 protein
MIRALVAGLGVLLVGGLLTFQPALNAHLARHTGVIGAAFVSSCVTTGILTVLLLAAGGGFGELRGVGAVGAVYLTGGVIGAMPLVIWAATVGTLGAGGVFAATVCGQMIVSAALLDRLGLAGLERIGLTAPRAIGIVLVIVGTLLVTVRT